MTSRRTSGLHLGLLGAIALVAAVLAGATVWLMLTDPVTVAESLEGGEISPLVRALADVLIDALRALLSYL